MDNTNIAQFSSKFNDQSAPSVPKEPQARAKDIYKKGYSRNAVAVWLYFNDRVIRSEKQGGYTGEWRTSYAIMQKDLGIGPKSLQRTIKELESQGYLCRPNGGPVGRGNSSVLYHLHAEGKPCSRPNKANFPQCSVQTIRANPRVDQSTQQAPIEDVEDTIKVDKLTEFGRTVKVDTSTVKVDTIGDAYKEYNPHLLPQKKELAEELASASTPPSKKPPQTEPSIALKRDIEERIERTGISRRIGPPNSQTINNIATAFEGISEFQLKDSLECFEERIRTLARNQKPIGWGYIVRIAIGIAQEPAEGLRDRYSSAGRAKPEFGSSSIKHYSYSCHLSQAARAFLAHPHPLVRAVGQKLQTIDGNLASQNLEGLEQQLCAYEDTVLPLLRSTISAEDVAEITERLEQELRPYRGKMSTEQLAMLERRYVYRAIFELSNVPRLSLFYADEDEDCHANVA